MQNRLRYILTAPANGPAELIMACTMLAYGLPVLLPPDEFPRYQVYAAIARIASETVWGAILVGIALWRIFAVCSLSYTIRTLASATSLLLWSFLCTLFLVAQSSSPGVWMFGTWALLEAWTMFRIGKTP